MSKPLRIELHPRLVLRRADEAIAFYQAVFDATLVERYVGPGGAVVHAGLTIGGCFFSLTEAIDDGKCATSTGASPVLLHLTVADPDAACARLVARGGTVLIPIEDRDYGKREGRVRDPFGHLWILSRPVEELSPDEIQRRLSS